MKNRKTFYEFFSGGGMARAGLGDAWQCLLANDISEKKTIGDRVRPDDEEQRELKMKKLAAAATSQRRISPFAPIVSGHEADLRNLQS